MKLKLLIICSLIAFVAQGQLNNTMFSQRASVVESDSNTLFFNMKMLGFNKNNEYFEDIADGYTLFGYQLNPSLSYQPTPHTRVDVGVYVQKDFGNDQYSEVQPTFTFKYTHGQGHLVFGTLEGATSHQLIEPLYDFERVLVNRLENGLQFYVNNDWLFFDTWLDWQNMLYPGENDQERLTGGLSMRYVLMDKTVRISIPMQLVVSHLGGQIDTSELPLQTYTNSAFGLMVDILRPDNKLLNYVRLEGYYTHYNDFSGVQLRPFADGDGYYINAQIKSKKGLELMVSYWKGNEFLTIQGGQLYPSESSRVKKPLLLEQERELLIFRLFHNLKITENITLSSRFEPHYDLFNERFEFSHGFYLNYTTDFYLLKNKLKRK